MQVLILAGGLGTRLGPVIENIPESMIPISGRPFLEYQIDLLRHHQIEDIVLCVRYLARKIGYPKNALDMMKKVRGA